MECSLQAFPNVMNRSLRAKVSVPYCELEFLDGVGNVSTSVWMPNHEYKK